MEERWERRTEYTLLEEGRDGPRELEEMGGRLWTAVGTSRSGLKKSQKE